VRNGCESFHRSAKEMRAEPGRTESLLDDVRWAGADPGDECNGDALAVAPEGVTDGFSVR